MRKLSLVISTLISFAMPAHAAVPNVTLVPSEDSAPYAVITPWQTVPSSQEVESLKRRVEDLEDDVKALIDCTHSLMISVVELRCKLMLKESVPIDPNGDDLIYRQPPAPPLDLDPAEGEWM